MLQVGDLNAQFIIDTRFVNPTKLLYAIQDKIFVGHNLKFEGKHFLVNYGIRFTKFYDTMLAEKVLYNGLNMKMSLKDLNYRYLGIEVDKTVRLEFLYIKKRPFTLRQIKYGAEDILYPLQIRKQQLKQIEADNVMQAISWEMKFVLCLVDMECNGIGFDKDVWRQVYEVNKEKHTELVKVLNSIIEEKYPMFCDNQLSMFDPVPRCAIKWSSPKQVVEFFKHLGICPKARSKSTGKIEYTVVAKEMNKVFSQPGVSEDVLDLVKVYIEMKECEQAVTTFGIDFFKYIHPITGRIHSDFNQLMNTSRLSSRNPNQQNIPGGDEYRKAFVVPEGMKMICADYSSQESLILVNKSRAPNLVAFYDSGETDLHSYFAREAWHELKELSLKEIKKKHKDKRSVAKTLNFGLAYGAGPATLSANALIPIEEAERLFETYYKTFPGLKKFFDECHKQAMVDEYIEISRISHRRYYFPKMDEMRNALSMGDRRYYEKLKAAYCRKSQNYKIQGEAAECTKLALIYIRAYQMKHNCFDKFKVILTVHDEILLEAPEEHAELAKKVLEVAMVAAGKVFCDLIPLNAEAEIADYWVH